MNRLALLPPLLCALLVAGLLVTTSGCQRSTGAPGTTAEAQQGDPNAQVLAEIKTSQEQMARDLAEFKQWRELEAREQSAPPVVRDLPVARAALEDAVKAVQSKHADAATAAVKRLQRVLDGLASELPGAIIARNADRALSDVQSQRAVGSKQFVDATLEIEAAISARGKSGPAELVPDVLNDLEAAKKAIVAGNADEAIRLLNAIIERATSHPMAEALSHAEAAARGAREALGRQAWPVVAAELEEIDTQLTQVGKVVRPAATTPEPKAETPTAATPTVAPTVAPTPVPTPTPPAAGATTPSATTAPAGQPPAASPLPAASPAAVAAPRTQ